MLYREVVRLARSLRPRFVVIENVPGMRKVGGVSFVRAVLAELDEAGYAAQDYLLRACDFGVPQLRHRILYLAQQRTFGDAPPQPTPTHCPGRYCPHGCGHAPSSRCNRTATTPSVIEALSTLPVVPPGTLAEYELIDGTLVVNGSTMNHSAKVIDKIRNIEAGKGPISYRRLHSDLARTIVAGHRALPVHPVEHRTISVREAARIQGFEDDHVFCGPRGAQPLQVANAVPPALARAVADELFEILDPVAARRARREPLPKQTVATVAAPQPSAIPRSVAGADDPLEAFA